jgi:hypothetical protein
MNEYLMSKNYLQSRDIFMLNLYVTSLDISYLLAYGTDHSLSYCHVKSSTSEEFISHM